MSKQAKSSTIPADRIDAYDRLIATRSEVVRKGASIPYTSLNGHMTSYLTDTGSLVLRLPVQRNTAYGTVQKEFVDVPDALFEDTASIAPWFAASLAWIGGLKPKPTRRSS